MEREFVIREEKPDAPKQVLEVWLEKCPDGTILLLAADKNVANNQIILGVTPKGIYMVGNSYNLGLL